MLNLAHLLKEVIKHKKSSSFEKQCIFLQTYFSGSVLLSLILNICIPCQKSEEGYRELQVHRGADLPLVRYISWIGHNE